MRIVYIVNAHSPISRCWIDYLIERGCDVHVISSYPCPPDVLPGARIYPFPVAFSRFSRPTSNGTVASAKEGSLLSMGIASLRTGALSGLATAVRFWVGPLELQRYVQKVNRLIAQISPDMVHAMRIPFEGILAAKATPAETPLLISVWGNDLTLWAVRNSLIARQTRQALRRADALHCDCKRDLDLAKRTWDFESKKPTIVLPGAGGVQAELFHPGYPDSKLLHELGIADNSPVIFNPRGVRDYVRNDVFFQAIPRVLERYPKAIFVCAGMQSNAKAENWIRRLSIQNNVRLLPSIDRERMAEIFRMSSVAVSPSLHDGTPNTLLEAMACGCFPVAGDIESVREWVTDKANGLLCDPTDSDSLASAIVRALSDEQLRSRARALNIQLIAERAEYTNVMQQAEEFYVNVVERNRARAQV
jgi:glycosyltransferase involved in cell wall biosynthesis